MLYTHFLPFFETIAKFISNYFYIFTEFACEIHLELSSLSQFFLQKFLSENYLGINLTAGYVLTLLFC